jgi:hypothetical protein
LVLGWSTIGLVWLYWAELGVMLWWAGVRALFAQRPSKYRIHELLLSAARHKRGSVPLPVTDLRVRLQELPGLVLLFTSTIVFWVVVGGLMLSFVAEAEQAVLPLLAGGGLPTSTALLSVSGLFVIDGLVTIREYFQTGQYEKTTIEAALRPVATQVLILSGTVVALTQLFRDSLSPVIVLVVLIGVRSTTELASILSDGDRSLLEEVLFDPPEDPPNNPLIDPALPEPTQTVRPHPLGVLFQGAVSGSLRWFPVLGMLSAGVVLLGILVAAFGDVLVIVVLGGMFLCLVFFGAIALGIFDYGIQHRWMEYRVAEDVVAYDRLFREAQWRLTGRELQEARTIRTIMDHLFGTETVIIETDERTLRCPHLAEPTALTGD